MSARRRARGFWGTSGSLAVAITVANVATYGFTVLAARLLGPQEYGAVASLLATLLVVSVLPLGLQATGARRVSNAPTQVGEIRHELMRVSWRAALVLGLLLLALAPLISRLLKVDGNVPALLLAACAVPLTLWGAQCGIVQGERRWAALSLIYLALGIPRLVFGVGFITWHATQQMAMLGITVAAVVPAVVGWLALRRRADAKGPPQLDHANRRHPTRDILRETAHNSQALLAYFALSNVDVIVARHALDQHRAGLYAAGLILAKAMMFLPQFVVVVAFPDMSTEEGRRDALLKSLALVAGLGVLGVMGAFALRSLALVFVGGSAYAQVTDRLWMFALLGTILSMLQLLVYAVLARSGRRPVLLVWATFVVVVVVGSMTASVSALLTVVLVCDSVLLLALLVTDVRRLPAARPDPVGAPPAF